MRSRLKHVVVAGAVLAAIACAVAASNPARAGTCAPGMYRVTVAGQPGFRYCGPASATVKLGTRAVLFANGLCRQAAGVFTVNIGTSVPTLRSGKPRYFGITTHSARAGKQRNAAIAFAFGGRSYAVADQVVVVAPRLRKGTFAGRIFGSAARVTGAFACGA